MPQDELPSGEVLDIVYSPQSLLTSTGRDGGAPSSSSAPTLMARLLEALDLRPGMRVLEIGAGTSHGTAWVHNDGSLTATGQPTVAAELRTLIHHWTTSGRPALTQFTATFELTKTAEPLWAPSRWTVNAGQSAAHSP